MHITANHTFGYYRQTFGLFLQLCMKVGNYDLGLSIKAITLSSAIKPTQT